jgi:translation initiation factor IF-2
MKNENQNLISRPPIVVVMGHIDHGKTTLLDFIRKTKIAEKESGGITQHIGAYEIETHDKKITFIDTPGHEAFSKMRQRGTRVADLAILVVAADDGVKAQTIEAIAAIKEAKIPYIVAINKIDKENANPERIKKELAEKEVYVENAGGKVPCVNISAKTGQGIGELLDLVLLLGEMEELKADQTCPASGIVIESHLDQKRGIAATLIIQNGTLKKKMFINAGGAIAPVKIFENFLGKPLDEASFSSPVKIVGFDKVPEAGTNFRSYELREEAEKLKPEKEICPVSGSYKEIEGEKIIIPLVIKADVSGSLEALEKEILKSATEKIDFNILRLNVGNINEDDVKLAASGLNPIIIGFRVKMDSGLMQMAERANVAIVLFDIIYKINEWLEEEIKKRLPEAANEEILGTAELIKVFSQEKSRQIIGGKVLTGKIASGKNVKISRRGAQIAKGKILELQHYKMKVPELEQGKEFGALIDVKTELAKGDLIEIYS